MSKPMATRREPRFTEWVDQVDDDVERVVRVSLDWLAFIIAVCVLLGACIGIYAAERAQARVAATEIVQP